MVGKWRQRFIDRRIDGLLDEPRPGAPRKITDEDVEQVIVQTLETTPRDATHKTPAIRRWLAKRPRFHVHFTPTSASWINLVERWFATLTAKQIRRGTFRSTLQLEATIKNYITICNEDPKPFVWTKTADEILDSIARFCMRTSETGH